VIAEHQGHVPIAIFQREARRPDKLVISRYDGSATADAGPDSERARGDALFDGLRALLAQAMTGYLAGELGLSTDLPYTLQSSRAFRTWNWRTGRSNTGYAGAAHALDELLYRNPAAKVVIAHGMTDLVTPYMTSRYVIDRLPPLRTAGRVTVSLHPGGHMMYLRAGSRAGLHADAAKIYPAP
jgi:carboxypeptidase C (cathepsin A)